MSKIDHVARAIDAWPILCKLAQKGKKITYGELSRRLGLHHRSARWFLGVIQTKCLSKGFPPLQAIVVNKRTGVPGLGYVATAREGKHYSKAVCAVHEYTWPKKMTF